MLIYGSHLRILGNGNVAKSGKFNLNCYRIPLFWGGKKKHTHEWAKITATAIMKLSYPETRIKYHGVLM